MDTKSLTGGVFQKDAPGNLAHAGTSSEIRIASF
jgi:hypothetical protein